MFQSSTSPAHFRMLSKNYLTSFLRSFHLIGFGLVGMAICVLDKMYIHDMQVLLFNRKNYNPHCNFYCNENCDWLHEQC